MAVYKIFPSKDATMYSMYPTMNTGLDPIIESTLTSIAPTDPNPQTSRFLIKFEQDEIEDVINNKVSGSSWQANLRCYIAKTTGLKLDTTIDVYAVSSSWGMGTGKYLDVPLTTDGVSWQFTDESGSNLWPVTSVDGIAVSSSYNTSYALLGGGTWFNQIISGSGIWPNANLSSSQVYNYAQDKDLNTNVTNIVNVWLTGSFNYYASSGDAGTNTQSTISSSNEGFLVKQRLEWVYDNNFQPEVKFFSIDTNTIYPPQLEFKWNDSIYETGSLPVISGQDNTVTLAENPGVFYSSSINRFRVNARPTYPARVWQTGSYYTQNYALPEDSYWALKDLDTNEYVIDFDTNYTKLSCDSSGSYMDVYMNGLEPERYYALLIKTIIGNSTYVFDDNYYFKVTNG
jgi:hypothetical protein